jgi:cytochrome d ubiquinol oxidase subunit II
MLRSQVPAFAGLAPSLYPCLIPPGVTIAGTAAGPLTLKVMLVGVALLLPLLLIYNACQFRVFRGTTRESGYG